MGVLVDLAGQVGQGTAMATGGNGGSGGAGKKRASGGYGGEGGPASICEEGQVVLAGPRTPPWSCGSCGQADNWRSRLVCRGCGREAPAGVRAKAYAAAKEATAQARSGQAQGGGRRRTGSGSGGAGTDKGKDKVAEQAAELQRLRQELKKAKQANGGGGGKPTYADKVREGLGEEIASLRSSIEALEALDDADDVKPVLTARRAKLKELVAKRDGGKPLPLQQRIRDEKIAKYERFIAKIDEETLPDLHMQIDEATAQRAEYARDLADFRSQRAALGAAEAPREPATDLATECKSFLERISSMQVAPEMVQSVQKNLASFCDGLGTKVAEAQRAAEAVAQASGQRQAGGGAPAGGAAPTSASGVNAKWDVAELESVMADGDEDPGEEAIKAFREAMSGLGLVLPDVSATGGDAEKAKKARVAINTVRRRLVTHTLAKKRSG